MLALRLTAIAAVLPLIVSAAHVPRGRQHRRSPAAVAAAPLVPRARPAEPNAGHKSARSAIKRSLKKKAGGGKRACAAATATSTSAAGTDAYAVAATTTSSPGADYASPTDTWTSSSTWAAASSTSSWAAASTSTDGSAAWLGDWAQQSSSPATSTSSKGHHSSSGDTLSSLTSAAASAVSSVASSVSGLLDVTDDTCGWCDSSDSAPNGSEDWLNCGVTGGGWTPPYVTLAELSYVDLDASGPFAACSEYFYLFQEYGPTYNVPPIMLASFALQESTCNEWATGGNGEAGLMQLAQANCADAPDGNCYDLDYNVKTAASYFASLISQYDGNVLEAIGNYNGWESGMTVSSATAAAGEGDCSGQNNLDYIAQMVNGWMQGVDGTTIGTYFNLNSC